MSEVVCIHRRLVDECAICRGYWSYLESRFEGPPQNTPTTRRAFWQFGASVVAEQAMYLKDRQVGDSPGPIAQALAEVNPP